MYLVPGTVPVLCVHMALFFCASFSTSHIGFQPWHKSQDALTLNCLCFAFMQHLEDTVHHSKYYQYSSSCNIEAEYMWVADFLLHISHPVQASVMGNLLSWFGKIWRGTSKGMIP